MIDETKPTSTEQQPPESNETGGMALSKTATLQAKGKQGKASNRHSSSTRDTAGAKHILFGRGKGYANSPGNQRMRRIIDKYRGQYIGGSRTSKRRLLRKAYNEIVEGGVKFLKQGGNEDEWVEVEAEVAMRKVGHSMRWRKGNIQESPTNDEMTGQSVQDHIPTSDNRAARLALGQGIMAQQEEIMNQQRIPSAVSMQRSEGAPLRRAIEEQQQTVNLDIPLLPSRMTSSLLVRQRELERLRSMGLIERLRLPTMQPTVARIQELEALRAIERDQELRRIIASRRNIWFPP